MEKEIIYLIAFVTGSYLCYRKIVKEFEKYETDGEGIPFKLVFFMLILAALIYVDICLAKEILGA